jgi:16S rRNA (cytosine1402-N4)-methyltransferase
VEVNGDDKTISASSHVPVLLHEVVQALHCRRGGRFVDCTLGQGELAFHILQIAGPHGFLVGIDRDEQALAVARERLKRFDDRTRFVQGNFQQLKQHLNGVGISEVDGIVFDLGVSSAQLNQPARGFSFMHEGPLDMRMDRSAGLTAADFLHQHSEKELADVIFQYGEERYSRRIARAIVQARARRPLRTTLELVSVIRDAVPLSYRHGRIHVATRTFQALRIAVNRELEVLEESFRDAVDVLVPGGRLCIISFHSLEDRIAKQTLRSLSAGAEPHLKLITKKPLVPSETERRANPRARSAKLRVAERLPVRRCA